ncbi:sensor histidine kinase [Rickettsiales endosymbiont of Stachyamoeba lipophora]|uniref:sensor histidine kinase n=1 Tax=Rickettsiales endosymbiont of Stachyamoeba lipophora TaxID=2486578 RepID=UPI0013DDBFF7|nr:HAMP domain-containing sensor histidine kinase [Rickettsiales endosymbiont of Stachyamoeba lipophora]
MFYLWVGWLNYNKIKSDYRNELQSELYAIDAEIIRALDYISYLSIFIENQVKHYNSGLKNEAELADLAKLFVKLDYDYRKLNLPPISRFTWVNPNREIIINSQLGLLSKDKIVSLAHRKSIYFARKNPSKVVVDEPSYGTLSKIYLLPVVKAVCDNITGELIGYINIGLSIGGLSKYFEGSMNTKEISYIIFTESGTVITQSSKHKIKVPKTFFIEEFANGIPKKLKFNGVEYAAVYKSSKYPVIIAVGYYPSVIWADIKNSLSLQIAPFILMCILFIVILYEFRNRLFKPLFNLTKCADEISRGNLDVEIPQLEVIELDNFATQLGKIKSYINEIIEIENQLRFAKLEADRANNAKSQFLANMSHELRTPLFTVTGYAEAIKEQIYGPVGQEYLIASDNILYAGRHLLTLINDILDLSKAEAGSMELHEDYIDVVKNITGCLQFILQMANKKNIKVINQSDEMLPLLYADELRFRQIILNIISNAIKFTDTNGLITINTFIDNNSQLKILIKDNGVGVDEGEIPLILSEFGQARNAYLRTDYQGTGLGLPLAIKFTKMHGGQLDFHSEVGKGTEVIITFPAFRLKRECENNEQLRIV